MHNPKFKIPKESNNMDTKSNEQFIIMQATIKAKDEIQQAIL